MMIFSAENRATLGRVLALGFVLATLLAALLSAAPADAAKPSGKASSWGNNTYGQLGNDATGGSRVVPGAVSNLRGVGSVKAGCYHGLALMNDGTVRAWGQNYRGQLGDATGDPADVPVEVRNLTDMKAVSAGCEHNLALKEDGSVWAWGSNLSGELGNGTSGAGAESRVPVKVASLGTGAKGIAAGAHFSLALMKDGTVRSWGNNDAGSLGDTTNTHRSTPVPVYNLSNVKAIDTDSSAHHSLALLNDGTVRSWGYNGSGQLGDTTKRTRTVPVPVYGLSGVKAVAVGEYHSLALLTNGKVRAWGQNTYGQLGDGTSVDRTIHVEVNGLSGVRSIAGGAYHSLAILENGKARSWGKNIYGELGNGASGEIRYAPGPVENLAKVRNIDGGNYFTLATTG